MRMLSSTLLFLLMLLPLSAFASDMPTMWIATDLHYISPSLTDNSAYFMRMIESGDGKIVHYIDELTDALVEQAIEQRPDCLILSGDLTFNGAKKSHEDLAAKLRRIDEAGVSVYVLPGNHDVYCYSAASFSGDSYTLVQGTTSEDFEAIYHDLGFDEALARDPYSLSYIAEPIPGIRLLMLDVNTQFSSCAVAQNTFAWLDEVLAKAKTDGAKVIAVSHQNLYAHSSLLYQGFMIANASMLESRYEKYSVAVNLSGHVHMQHTISVEGKVPEIATSSLAVSPCQYGVITLGDNHASYRTETVNVSAWAKAHGKTDPNLLDFAAYARDFFLNTSLRLKQTDDPDADTLAKWIAEVNAAYFAGRTDLISPASAAATIAGDAFHSAYIASILAEPPRDHTQLDFPL
ncbi:MAG: hypothetical protein E7321_05730 [Clostridiales bacterium]|nr:hypothetical protein [Clostridiales bacterium]